MGQIRDRVLDEAHLQRHHVVLDLNAGSGLLTWEVLRRTPEGGTWCVARDRQAGEGLRQQAERLPGLERPIVLVGEPGELPELLGLRGEGDVRFDAIVGRNALGPLLEKGEILRILAGLLQPGGRLSLAETMVKRAQRLYDLVDLSPLGDDLRQRVIEAEEQIYTNEADPLVNWESADLKGAIAAAGLVDASVQEEVRESEMFINLATLDSWFDNEPRRERPSYAQHLLTRITPEELLEVRELLRRQLDGHAVPWQSHIAFASGRLPG